uniref:Uncharacterized protein n=1 Tax=Rhizophora mucronata TaxID=61149 RepID=A0A2P2PAS1_RHIMU
MNFLLCVIAYVIFYASLFSCGC